MSHSQATAYVNKVEDNCTSTLCNAPDVAPVTCKGALCIIHDFIFEKIVSKHFRVPMRFSSRPLSPV